MTTPSDPPPQPRDSRPIPGPGLLWWILAIPSLAVGVYAMSLQDAREAKHSVPGLPWADEVHFIAGGLALAIGSLGFRRDLLIRAREWHKKIGWLYVLSVTLSGIAGLLMAVFSMGGMTTHLGFGCLAVLWLGTTAAGIRAIQQRRVADHRRWMVYSFALTFAAVSLRIQLGPLAMGFQSFPAGYKVVSWSCWVPNLVVAWWWLRREPRPYR